MRRTGLATIPFVTFGIVTFLSSCHSCETSIVDPGDAAIDPPSSTDSELDSNQPQDGSTEDVETEEPDIADGSDDATDSGLSVTFENFDPSLWLESNSCATEVTYPPVDEEFELFWRDPPANEPVVTANELRQELADVGGLPLQGGSVRIAQSMRPGPDWPYDLYAVPGLNVPLHVYVINNYEDLSTFRLNLSVLVDYQPVEASYTRWNPDRTEELFTRTTSGVSFSIDSKVEIIDIVLPGHLFDEERMYEIALSFQTSTDRRPIGHSRRFALYNGGYDRPAHPCAEARLDAESTEIETALRSRISDDLGPLFFHGIKDKDAIQRTIDVAPGETMRMYFSALPTLYESGPKPTVLVPVLDGKPIGPTWWITQGGGPESEYRNRIDARKSFEVTFPEEPGIYEVQVFSWEDPYRIWRTRDGVKQEGVSDGSGLRENSNALRFRVVEPETE